MRFRLYLEEETRAIRAGLRDAEAWLARWEIEAALVDEVEAAEELVRIWRHSWGEHVELCSAFAEYANRVYAAERAKVLGLAGMTV